MNVSTEQQKSSVARRLRWARKQAGLSQGQVAEMLDMHRPTISQIEAGQRSVKSDEIARFADIYDVKDEWIIRGDEVLADEDDPRIQLAARELGKLRQEDLDTILRVIRVLRTDEEE